MPKLKKRLKSPELKRREAHGDRCADRHPTWSQIRCVRSASEEHWLHHTEGFGFEWIGRPR